MTEQQVQDMLKEVDSDNSGSIEFDEFCAYMLKKLNKAKQPPNPNELRKRAFDVCVVVERLVILLYLIISTLFSFDYYLGRCCT